MKNKKEEWFEEKYLISGATTVDDVAEVPKKKKESSKNLLEKILMFDFVENFIEKDKRTKRYKEYSQFIHETAHDVVCLGMFTAAISEIGRYAMNNSDKIIEYINVHLNNLINYLK